MRAGNCKWACMRGEKDIMPCMQALCSRVNFEFLNMLRECSVWGVLSEIYLHSFHRCLRRFFLSNRNDWIGPMIELSVWSVGEDEQTCSFTWFHIKISTDFWFLCSWACWQVWKTAILLWWSSPPLGVGSTFKKVKINLTTVSNRMLQPRWPWIDSREGHWTILVDEHFKVGKS